MLDPDTMTKILVDIGTERAPENYTPEMLRFRRSAEQDLAEARKKNPKAHIHLPADINGLPGGENDR